MKLFQFLFLLLVLTVSLLEGARILITAPSGTRSHQNAYVPLAKELVRKGHHITIITNYHNEELAKVGNVEQVWVEELAVDMSVLPNPFTSMENLYKKLEAVVTYANLFLTNPIKIAQQLFEHQGVKELIKSQTFDLVMINEACGLPCYPFGWIFKAPVIMMSPNAIMPGRAQVLGDDEQLSYAPFLLSSFTDKMNLKERILNVIISKVFYFFFHDWKHDEIHSIVKRLVHPECPSLHEIEKNVSLVFTNSHVSSAYPRVLPPQVIEVGGLHCRPARPLPDELEKFVSESEAGFIIFGVGSALKMDDMPENVIQSFIKAFSRLPQRVIWQWKGKVRPDLSKNVLAIPWLPQQDLLGHRNCKAFITHGGLNSIQEAIFHGVPLLGMPLGTDQSLNVARSVAEGYAVRLDWPDVTEESLITAIQKLLHNSSYKSAAKRISGLFRDQLQMPLDRAVYWTEFVIRHKGTDHLRLGSVDLAPYQRALIDVYAVLILIALIPFLITGFCIRRCCFRRSVSLDKKNK